MCVFVGPLGILKKGKMTNVNCWEKVFEKQTGVVVCNYESSDLFSRYY